MQDHIPSKMTHGKFDLLWMTWEAKHLYRRKRRAYNIARKSLKASDWEKFSRLRKALQTNLKRAYRDYVNRLLDPSEDKGSKGL